MSIINLTDHFTSPTGEFVGYLGSSQNPVPTGKHLNIRSFHANPITIPNSMINNRNTNVFALNGSTMATLNSSIPFTGVNVPALEMDQIDVMTMASLDSNRMINMEDIISPGVESWTGVTEDTTLSLTASGNEITDSTRQTASTWTSTQLGGMVDFQSIPGGFGIWRQAKNDFTRGQCSSLGDTATGIWGNTPGANGTIGIDTTTAAPFSNQSVIGTANTTGTEIWEALTPTGQALTAGTTLACSIWAALNAGNKYVIWIRCLNTDSSTSNGTTITITAGDGSRPTKTIGGKTWEKITANSFAVASGKTGDRYGILVQNNTATTETVWFAHAMAEHSQSYIAPYVATSGGSTATQNAGRVQAPNTYLSGTQGWVAARVKMGFPSANATTNADIFDWRTDVNNRIHLRHNPITGKWEAVATIAGVETVAQIPASFNAQDIRTVIMAWGAFGIAISLNGSAFTTVSASLPSITGTTFDIGSAAGINQINSDILWFLCGTGSLQSSDLTFLNGISHMNWGAANSLSSGANSSLLWDASTATASTPQVGSSSFSLTKDSLFGYLNTIQIPLTDEVESIVSSTYIDDLETNFTDYSDYVIALQLLNFPAQTASAYLDLNNSYIDFTSDAGYAPSLTDTFSFSQSQNDITGGGNVTWQIARSSLTHVDLSNIVGIRFRLSSIGNMTFEAANMGMYSPSALNDNYITIDTKRGWVYKNFGYETTSGIYGKGEYGSGDYNVGGSVSVNSVTEMILPGSRPKNVTVVTKFMPGSTIPTSPSSITLYARQYGFPINGVLTFSSSGSTLAINDTNGNLYTSGTLAALSANQEYYLVFEAYEDQLRISVWNGSVTFYGSNIFTSSWQTTLAAIGRGYIGFEFNPANYDSYMKYFTVGDSEFARYESKVFQRFTNVKGAAIAAITSEPINLVQGVYNNYGDGTNSTDFTKGDPLPPSILVQRSGTDWSGGLITNPLFLANPLYLTISGDIYPVPTGSTINGEYKIVFQNNLKQIGYIATLENLLPNQWNHFEIPFNGSLAADNYQVIFEQTGYFADSFYLDNFALNYLTFAWEVSPDNGTTFYPFLSATGDQWSGVNFINNPGNSLIVRGIALTDESWVQSYELAPIKK